MEAEYTIENNKLIFNYRFNKPLDNYYEIMKYNNITQLEFGYYSKFNQPIDNLPNSLTHLELGSKFNQEIFNLPNSLTYLMFNTYSYFNKEIDNLQI
jgi:hypothetical protein